jgi:hypothetical protein
MLLDAQFAGMTVRNSDEFFAKLWDISTVRALFSRKLSAQRGEAPCW